MTTREEGPFSVDEAVEKYVEGPPVLIPGFGDMQRMVLLLLSERVREDGSMLVLGAGGGLEIKVFADARAGWSFCGVDPSEKMLRVAEKTIGDHGRRVDLCHGYIQDAPQGPFDGATALLTFHFVSVEERRRTLAELKRRLHPGAPLVVAHMSFSQDEGERELWLSRYVSFAVENGAEPEKMERSRRTIDQQLTILTPELEEEMLKEAGFSGIRLFYAGFAFRGWVGYS